MKDREPHGEPNPLKTALNTFREKGQVKENAEAAARNIVNNKAGMDAPLFEVFHASMEILAGLEIDYTFKGDEVSRVKPRQIHASNPIVDPETNASIQLFFKSAEGDPTAQLEIEIDYGDWRGAPIESLRLETGESDKNPSVVFTRPGEAAWTSSPDYVSKVAQGVSDRLLKHEQLSRTADNYVSSLFTGILPPAEDPSKTEFYTPSDQELGMMCKRIFEAYTRWKKMRDATVAQQPQETAIVDLTAELLPPQAAHVLNEKLAALPVDKRTEFEADMKRLRSWASSLSDPNTPVRSLTEVFTEQGAEKNSETEA